MDPNDIQKVGPYPVRRYIAEGGMAWVFEVFDERLEIRRALKLLKPEAARGEQFRRFQKEARLLAQFKHDNLISVFDFGFDDVSDCYYYVMELVEGDPLSGKGRLPIEQAVPIYLHALNGLAQLHDRDIVHRDIKPSNIIVSDDGRVLLADLGIARSDMHSSGLTQTVGAIGTYLYMSPEQAGGTEDVNKPSDVFSMGLSLFQSMVGSSVYDHIDDVHTTNGQNILFYLGALMHSGGEIDFAFPADFHQGVAKVISKACRFHAEERYANAREMYEALYEAFYPSQPEEKPVAVAPIEPPIDTKKLGIAAVAGLVVLVLLWQGWSWFSWRGVNQAVAEVETERDTIRAQLLELEASPFPMTLGVAETVEAELARARTALDGARLMVEERVDGWETLLERASRTYQGACAAAVDGHLAPEFEKTSAAADASIEALEAGGAAAHATEELAALRSLRGELTASSADGACARMGELQTTLDRYFGAFVSRESEIANALAVRWPEHLATLRAELAQKGAEATQAERSEPSFVALLAEARAQIDEAEGLEAVGEFAQAESKIRETGTLYETASRVARMLSLRDGVIDIAAEAQSDPAEVLAPIDAAMRARDWEAAERGLESALAGQREKIVTAEKRGAAQASLGKAEGAEQSALRFGADRSAPEAFARANTSLGDARRKFDEGNFDASKIFAERAAEGFVQASDRASDALTRVKEAGDRAKELRNQFAANDPCSAVAPKAQAPCREGIVKFDGGAMAIAGGDAPAAQASFDEAVRLLERAKAENDRYDPAPEVQGLWPPAGRVLAYRGQVKNFKVQATDARGDTLRTQWLYRNQPQPAQGESPEASFEHALTVDREGGTLDLMIKDESNTIRAGSWEIVVENRAPELKLSPEETSLKVDTRGSQAFVAEASDPDDDAVTIAFLLDGEPVLTQTPGRFTFEPAAAGTHELSVVATDAGGKSTTALRKIEAFERPNRAPRLKMLTPPPGTLKVGDSVEFKTSASDPDGDPVTITYLVRDVEAGSGSTFRFVAKEVGNFDIQIIARDDRGETDKATGYVKVIAADGATGAAP